MFIEFQRARPDQEIQTDQGILVGTLKGIFPVYFMLLCDIILHEANSSWKRWTVSFIDKGFPRGNQ